MLLWHSVKPEMENFGKPADTTLVSKLVLRFSLDGQKLRLLKGMIFAFCVGRN